MRHHWIKSKCQAKWRVIFRFAAGSSRSSSESFQQKGAEKKWKFTNLACNILNLHNIVRLWLVWQVWLIKSSYPQLIGWVWLITGGVPNFWSRLSKKILSFLRLLKPGYFHPPGWLDCFLVGWAWAGVVALCTPLGVHLPHQPLDEVADIYPCKASWKNMAPKGFPAQS